MWLLSTVELFLFPPVFAAVIVLNCYERAVYAFGPGYDYLAELVRKLFFMCKLILFPVFMP